MHLQLCFNTINAVLFSVNLASYDNCEDWQNSCPKSPPWQKYQPGGIATKAQVLILCKTYGERHGATNSAIRGAVGQRNSKILPGLHDETPLFHLEFCVSGIPNR